MTEQMKEGDVMAGNTWNYNIRFCMANEKAAAAWERLHSKEVQEGFKSQNAFIIEAINDYYERHLAKKDDPYLETREKEDAFAERISASVEKKVLSNLPALAAMYQMSQQALLQGSLAVGLVPFVAPAAGSVETETKITGGSGGGSPEPEDNDLLEFDVF